MAAALAGVIAGARGGMNAWSAPATAFPVLPDLKHGEGDTVNIAVALAGQPAGVTYSVRSEPPFPAQSIAITGVNYTDDQGVAHSKGVLTGTWPTGVANTNPMMAGYTGSEGTYRVTVTASDGTQSNAFTWDIGRWASGDLFVGAGEFNYRVFSQDGDFKYDVTVPEVPRFWTDPTDGTVYPVNGSTTGCAANWHTGEVWVTNLDDTLPAVNVITRHSGSSSQPYTEVSRRLATDWYLGISPFSVDISPESVAFDNNQNMYVGHTAGFANANGDPADINGKAVWLTDQNGDYVVVDATGAPLLTSARATIPFDQWVSPDGFYTSWATGSPEYLLLNRKGAHIPVRDYAGADLQMFPLVSGGYTNAVRSFFHLRHGASGTDELELLSDQKTALYTSESQYVYRYDVSGTGAQLPVLGSTAIATPRAISSRVTYGLRALPPGDGTGGYLVANDVHIDRLNQDGRIVQSYDIKDDPAYPNNDANEWFALAIAPEGRSFWVANRQDVYKIDIATGHRIDLKDGPKIHATDGVTHSTAELAGLCVMNEYRAAQEVCGATGLGDGIDDDQDGVIDEGCFRIEICSELSPGDDDGDGLVDFNDPDCGAPNDRLCFASGPTPASVAGFCDRANAEGDVVSILAVPPAPGWTATYTATGLPLGLTIDASTGTVTQFPLYSIVNPNSASTPPQTSAVTVQSTWTSPGRTPVVLQDVFNWTISNTNRVPVALDDSVTVRGGSSVQINVEFNDSDIDGDPISLLSFTQPAVGTGTVVQVGQDLKYTAPPIGFNGVTTFTYIVKDSYSPSGVSNAATVTVTVNDVPVAVGDSISGSEDVALPGSVAANDTPSSDGGNAWTVVTGPAHGALTLNTDGTFVYAPMANYNGADSFIYRLTDANGDWSDAVVTINLVPANDVPVAVADAYSTAEDTTLTGSVVGNDQSPDGGNVWTVVSTTTNGTLTFANGAFTYTPKPNFNGTDSFVYELCDIDGDCSTAKAVITITPVNDVPVAANDAYLMAPNSSITKNVSGNDTASGDGENVWRLTSNPLSGTLVFNADGTFAYTAATGFSGVVNFKYQICDIDNDCSNEATATITVAVANLAGRMTGGGTFGAKPSSTSSVTHGFELHCDVNNGPNNLEANWGKGERFHLEALQTASCTTDPSIKQAPPAAPFNTYTGTGWGYYNGTVKVNAKWVFTDAGEPGTKDTATLTLTNAITGQMVLSATGNISKGNQQAHKD